MIYQFPAMFMLLMLNKQAPTCRFYFVLHIILVLEKLYFVKLI